MRKQEAEVLEIGAGVSKRSRSDAGCVSGSQESATSQNHSDNGKTVDGESVENLQSQDKDPGLQRNLLQRFHFSTLLSDDTFDTEENGG